MGLRIFLGIVFLGLILSFLWEKASGSSSHKPDQCGLCHLMKNTVRSYKKGDYLDNFHRRAGVSCLDCHQSSANSEQIVRAVTYLLTARPAEPAPQAYEDSLCTRCHISMEHQAKRTSHWNRNPHNSHWPELKCGHCHVIHGKSKDFCAQCHADSVKREKCLLDSQKLPGYQSSQPCTEKSK